jgi:hypothetical protein
MPHRKEASGIWRGQKRRWEMTKDEYFSNGDKGIGVQFGPNLFRVGCQMFTPHLKINNVRRIAAGIFPPISNL